MERGRGSPTHTEKPLQGARPRHLSLPHSAAQSQDGPGIWHPWEEQGHTCQGTPVSTAAHTSCSVPPGRGQAGAGPFDSGEEAEAHFPPSSEAAPGGPTPQPRLPLLPMHRWLGLDQGQVSALLWRGGGSWDWSAQTSTAGQSLGPALVTAPAPVARTGSFPALEGAALCTGMLSRPCRQRQHSEELAAYPPGRRAGTSCDCCQTGSTMHCRPGAQDTSLAARAEPC